MNKTNKVNPISPEDVVAEKTFYIPDEIISAFNTLIVKHWDGTVAVFKQKEVVSLALANFRASGKEITKQQIFDNKYLNVEEIFQQIGWNVEYDKPGWDETYDAIFRFKIKF